VSSRYAPTFLVSLALLWGLSFPAISVGLEYLPPLLFAALRYDIAAALLLGYAALSTDRWRPDLGVDGAVIGGGGFFLVAGNGLLFLGQQTVPGGVAALIQALTPIVTALWAFALLGERLSPTGIAGVAVGFAGIGLIVQPDPGALLEGDAVGRLLIVVQVVSISLGGVLIQRADTTMERVPMTGWVMFAGAGFLHLFSLLRREGATASALDPVAIGSVAYLGVFSTAIAFVLYFTLLEERGAFEANLVTYLVPVVAAVAGVAFLGESIGPLSVVGFLVIFAGFVLLKREAIAEFSIVRG
jgi:drug/metabolite transporter (DMT)-like permease